MASGLRILVRLRMPGAKHAGWSLMIEEMTGGQHPVDEREELSSLGDAD